MADRYGRSYDEGGWRERERRTDQGDYYGRGGDYQYGDRDERGDYRDRDRNQDHRPWNGPGRGPEDAPRYDAGYESRGESGSRDYGYRRDDDWDRQYEGDRYTPGTGGYERSGRDREGGNYGRSGSYGGGRYNYGPARYDERGRGFRSFTSEDQGGRDFVAGADRPYGGYGRGLGSYSAGYFSGGGYGAEPNRGHTDRYEDRGFLERAGDRVSGWFGGDDDERRTREDYRGHGPANYTRSDERVLEDASDQLTDDWSVDARNITVAVDNGEVTLDGTVPNREQKHRAERCVERVAGVNHVQNNLRVKENTGRDTDTARATGETTTGTVP